MSLNDNQVRVLQAIADGHTSEEKLVNALVLPLETVRHYLGFFEKHNFIRGAKAFSGDGKRGFVTIVLTDTGTVALNNPDDLLLEDIPSKNDFRGASIYGLAVESQNSTLVSGGEVKNNSIINTQHNYPPEERQNLVETVQEIEALLQHLQQTYPTTTTAEQMKIATQVIDRIEGDPTFKQRAMGACKGGLLESIKSIPGGNVVVAMIDGWNDPNADS